MQWLAFLRPWIPNLFHADIESLYLHDSINKMLPFRFALLFSLLSSTVFAMPCSIFGCRGDVVAGLPLQRYQEVHDYLVTTKLMFKEALE